MGKTTCSTSGPADDRRPAAGHSAALAPFATAFLQDSRVVNLSPRVTNDVTTLQVVLTEPPIAPAASEHNHYGGSPHGDDALAIDAHHFYSCPPIILLAIFFGRKVEHLSTLVQDAGFGHLCIGGSHFRDSSCQIFTQENSRKVVLKKD